MTSVTPRVLLEALLRAPAGVAIVAPDGSLLFVNRALVQINSLPVSNQPARNVATIRRVLQPRLDEVRQRIRASDIDTIEEERQVGTGRTTRWCRESWHAIREEDGTLGALLGVVEDITSRRREEVLRRDRAERLVFANLLQHEISSPLTIVVASAHHLLRHDESLDSEARTEFLRDLVEAAERLEDIVGKVTTIAQTAGSLGETEPVLIRDVVDHCTREHRHRYPARNVAVSLEAADAVVEANASQLELVVRNLLDNAEKYSAPNQPIDLVAQREEGRVVVSVLDRGCGIRRDEAKRLFQPFFRSRRTAKRAPGSGLGLTVCRLLIHAHGGRIGAEQRKGGGAHFWFALPERREDPRDVG